MRVRIEFKYFSNCTRFVLKAPQRHLFSSFLLGGTLILRVAIRSGIMDTRSKQPWKLLKKLCHYCQRKRGNTIVRTLVKKKRRHYISSSFYIDNYSIFISAYHRYVLMLIITYNFIIYLLVYSFLWFLHRL